MARAPHISATDLPATLACIEAAVERGRAAGRMATIPLFFRADDIGPPSASFSALMDLFAGRRLPLCLALVPAWLSRPRWAGIERCWGAASSLWCWHQHGWRHRNHEPRGRKSEFGPARSTAAIERDLVRGRERLGALLGDRLTPFFTPPWNRCTQEALYVLKSLGLAGVSTSAGDHDPASPLPDLFVNVDLHTRKEPDGATRLDGLLREFEAAAASGRIGVMIHHQRMGGDDFALLGGLLDLAATHPRLAPVRFDDLVDGSAG